MSDPAHRAISGFVNDDFRWTYSVYDANQRDWLDVGTSHDEAEMYAARLPEPRIGD